MRRIGTAGLTIAAAAVLALVAQQVSACTGIMLKTKDGAIVHGRTLEFGVPVDTSVAVIPRGQVFTGQTPQGDGLKYTVKYGATGIVAFGNPRLLDGVNEAGLAAGSFYFPTFAGYATVTPENQGKALSPADFPNWVLTQFGSVDEVRKAVESGSVVIAPTVLEGWGPVAPPFHYVVYDKTGASLVIEPVGGKLVVHDNPLGVLTNSPSFDWHMTNLRNYIALNPRDVPPVKIDGQTFKALGQGTGMLGLPGDFSPPSRFVRAAVFSATAIPADNADKGVDQVFHILNNFDIPIGVSREVTAGAVYSDYTQMTVARDPQSQRYYYKTYDDQTIRMVDLKAFDLNAKTIRQISTRSEQPVVDMSAKLKPVNEAATSGSR
ncbi:MAG: linear amide C-N hydrolase [Pseudorhodoplanes sp.]|uniref:linear amide C-N hydrolase n=1 Tax=Pseudorhodoplanes sp. TaxID=1934341 RepID=UPI003D11DE40